MHAPRSARTKRGVKEARLRSEAQDGAGLGTLAVTSASDLAHLVRQAIDLVDTGKIEAAHALLAPHFDKDGGLGPAGARAALLIEGARILVRLGRHDEALTRARRGLALAEVDGDSRLAAEALNRLGLVELRRGDLRAARVSYEEARSRYRRLGAEDRVAAAENNLGLVCTGLGEWDAARAHFAEAIAITRRHGPADVLGYRLKNLGVLETKMGAWDRAAVTLEEARACFDRAGDPRHRATIALALGHLARLTRRFDDAARLLGEGLSQALAQQQLREEAVAREFLGDLALDRGDSRQAWQGYRAALALADRLAPALDLEVEILHRLARVQIRGGDLAGAARSLARARDACVKLGDPYEEARIAIVDAELLVETGRGKEAPSCCASAVETLTRLGERIERARALQLWAAQTGTAPEARRLLYRAAACCHEAGAAWELERIEPLLGAPAEPAPAPVQGSEADAGTPLAGKSRALVRVREAVQRAARSALPVLIEGPAGVGKDLIARTIHARSRRAQGPYVVVRCAALSPERALIELVGDARQPGAAAGLIDQANGGTLLLDDVGALGPAAQATLARLLASGDYLCPGELQPRTPDVRVIALSAVPLTRRVAAARFRADLRERLGAILIDVPPLTERTPDILPLARAFLRVYGGPDAPRIDDDAAERLIAHTWPGNARELELVIQSALIQTPAGARALDEAAVAAAITACNQAQDDGPSGCASGVEEPGVLVASAPVAGDGSNELRARLVEAERRELLTAIERAHGNKSRAARLLKVSRKTLYARLHRHGLALEDEAS
jgi:DNA-binding NtrC family response regulator/tetratricopeptide (TPR) repeat protein